MEKSRPTCLEDYQMDLEGIQESIPIVPTPNPANPPSPPPPTPINSAAIFNYSMLFSRTATESFYTQLQGWEKSELQRYLTEPATPSELLNFGLYRLTQFLNPVYRLLFDRDLTLLSNREHRIQRCSDLPFPVTSERAAVGVLENYGFLGTGTLSTRVPYEIANILFAGQMGFLAGAGAGCIEGVNLAVMKFYVERQHRISKVYKN